MVLGVRSLLDEIQWDEERTDETQAAWERLGRHLSFAASRPEQEYGTGPDDLWVTGSDRHAVTELKTGCTTDTIAKHDLDQLGGSVRFMVHPSRDCQPLGTPVPRMRVVTPTKLEELKAAVLAFAVTLANDQGRWSDEHAVASALAQESFNGGQIFTAYAETVRQAAAG